MDNQQQVIPINTNAGFQKSKKQKKYYVLLCFVIAISMFSCGYYLARYQKNKSIETEFRLKADKSIDSYCNQLRRMCEIMLDKVVAGSLDEKEQARYVIMMSTISNIHDELITLTDKGIEEFGCTLESKISDLMSSANAIGSEKDLDQNFTLISEVLSSMDEIKEWLDSYTISPEESVKTVAIEARELMNKNEAFIKTIEAGLKESGGLFWKNDAPRAREALIDYVNQAGRYKNAIEAMKNRQTCQS